MKYDRDPIRVTDPSSDASPMLRRLVRAGEREQPDAARMDRLSVAIAAKIRGPTGGGGHERSGGDGTSGSGGGGALSAATKAIAGGVVALGVAAIAWWAINERALEPSANTPIVVDAPAPPTVLLPPEPPSATASETSPRVVPPPPRKPSPASTPAPLPELDLLRRAQDALASDPGRAFALCTEHERAYPNGSLRQEREVLAIQALLKMGRRAQAEARAAQFARAFPASAHARRIEALLSGE